MCSVHSLYLLLVGSFSAENQEAQNKIEFNFLRNSGHFVVGVFYPYQQEIRKKYRHVTDFYQTFSFHVEQIDNLKVKKQKKTHNISLEIL